MTRRRRAAPMPAHLADAVGVVAADYHGFLVRQGTAQGPEEPKEFSARHTAAKTALAHLEQLVKLLGTDAEPEQAAALEQLLLEARAGLRAAEEEPSDDDPDAG